MNNTVIVRGIIFDFLLNNALDLHSVSSIHCEQELVSFINDNIRPGLNNIPAIKSEIEALMDEFNK